MFRLWKWYQHCLTFHPVKTQVISSGFLWGTGDIAAQYITHSAAKTRLPTSMLKKSSKSTGNVLESQACLDSVSLDQSATCGPQDMWLHYLYFHGYLPIFSGRYEGLDRFIRLKLQLQPKSAKFVGAKLAMDGLIFGPIDLVVFFSYMGFANGKDISEVKEDLKRDVLPAFILSGTVWPIIQVANFRYIPVRYQLLYVNMFCLLDSAFLSWFEQQNDAPWKQWFTSFNPFKER